MAPLATAQEHMGHTASDRESEKPAEPSDQTAEQSGKDHAAMGHTMPAKPVKNPPDHSQMDHAAMGHAMPAKPVTNPPDHSQMDHAAMGHAMPARPVTNPPDHSQMDHAAMGHAMPARPVKNPPDHSQMDHAAMGHAGSATNGKDETPPARSLTGPRHAADAIWGADVMKPSRDALARENGGMPHFMFMAERLEARITANTPEGASSYLWDVQGWYGSDLDKLWLKSEGEGLFSSGRLGALEDAEVQALWSHAIGPFFDLQAGVRLDIKPATRSHLVLGVQGLVPYMWEVDAAVLLSDRGTLTARVEAEYDQRITQRLILQPRAAIALSASAITASGSEAGTGAGVTKIEAGLRLRYEVTRQFAPYIGIEYEAKTGDTAKLARAAGEDPNGIKVLAGIRFWF